MAATERSPQQAVSVFPLLPPLVLPAQMDPLRTLISMATVDKWSLFQLDVKNNFLMGTFLKRFVCTLFRDFLIHLVFFVVSAALSVGSNSLLVLGMSAFNQLLCRLVSNLVYMNELFLFVGLLLGCWYSCWIACQVVYFRWCFTVTRPDIAYAVEVVSQFCPFVVLPVVLLFYVSCATFIALSTGVYCSPLLQVWLFGTMLMLIGPVTSHQKSPSSFLGFFWWFSHFLEKREQFVIAWYIAKAKYRAMSQLSSYVGISWFHWLLSYMGVSVDSPTSLYCDSKSAFNCPQFGLPWANKAYRNWLLFRSPFSSGTIDLPFVLCLIQLADVLLILTRLLDFSFYLANSRYFLCLCPEFEGDVNVVFSSSPYCLLLVCVRSIGIPYINHHGILKIARC